jgi:hypothetical protein
LRADRGVLGETDEREDVTLPSNRLENLRRRVNRARKFPDNTCPASRHLHLMAEALAAGKPYPMLAEEPEHCAESMLWVLEHLWKARTKMARSGRRVTNGGV